MAIPTTGDGVGLDPSAPKNRPSPNAKIPPSLATNQYPRPEGDEAMPTTGRLRRWPRIDPCARASPNARTLPVVVASQKPLPLGVEAIATVHSPGAAVGRTTLVRADAPKPATVPCWVTNQ